jgi:hypothetical protein
MKLCKKDHKLYNKCIINENSFSWVKQYDVLNSIYEKSIASYKGLLLLAISYTIYNKHKRLQNHKQLDVQEKQEQERLKQMKREQRKIKRHLDKEKRKRERDQRKECKKTGNSIHDNIGKILYEIEFGKKKLYIIIEG